MPDIVIVGAGIAGLSAAWELVQRGHRPVVLERASRPGGVILTEHVDGFVIDGGPDSLLVQKPAAIELCRELGLGDRLFPVLPPRTAYVLRGGRLIPLPEASVLGIPTRMGPFLATELFSWPGKLRMALELLIAGRREEADESIASFIRRRFGREAVTYLAEPLLAGIHSGDVERLSLAAAFPRLAEAERTHGSVLRAFRSLRSPPSADGAFKSLPGGIGELVDTLVARLPEGTIRYASGVASLEQARPGTPFTVTTTSGEALETSTIIMTAPAWAVSPLLSRVDAELSRLIGQIPYASSAAVVTAWRRAQIQHPLNGTGFVVPRSEGRRLMAASWVSSKWPHRAPPGHALLRGFLGGARDPAILDQDDAALAQATIGELGSILQISGEPIFSRVYRWPRASAQHEVGHLARMADIDRRLDAHRGLFVTGSGFRGTGIPDCVADARASAARAALLLG